MMHSILSALAIRLLTFFVLMFSSFAYSQVTCRNLIAGRDLHPRSSFLLDLSNEFLSQKKALNKTLVKYYGFEIKYSSKSPAFPRGKTWVYPSFPSETEINRRIKKIARLGSEYGQLLFHPGVLIRVDEFVNFVESSEVKFPSPWEALDQFRIHLGTKTVYRALALTKGELSIIQKQGLTPNLGDFTEVDKKSGLAIRIKNHISKKSPLYAELTGAPGLQSVSQYPEVSLSVAEGFRKGHRKVYLFKLKIPTLDLIFGDQKVADSQLYFHHLEKYLSAGLIVWYPDGRKRTLRYGAALESLIFGSISTDEIVSVSQTHEQYNGIETEWIDFN